MHNYVIGRGGLISADKKREGDGCTPLGIYPLREVWYRSDRIARPTSGLPVREISKLDCWCDDPEHELYNRHFRSTAFAERTPPLPLPQGEGLPKSFEHLWRDDHAYDVIVVIGYNDDPVVPYQGSAIFIHCHHDDGRPTAGCVALSKEDMIILAKQLHQHATIQITEQGIHFTI